MFSVITSNISATTFPEEAIPLMTARQTMIQATSRDKVIFTLSPPLSAMLLVVLRVWRYQNLADSHTLRLSRLAQRLCYYRLSSDELRRVLICVIPTGHPDTAQTGTDVVPDPDAPTPDLLTHSQLQEEERDADEEEEDKVREAPHVPQAHGEAHLSQDVLQFAVPGGAAIVFWHLYLRDLFPGNPSNVQGAVLVVERLLVREQIGHRLCDVLMALLTLRHLAVLRHQGG
ncbi:hypothetical protein EYF80_004239 [Liparis tanakae]|uniref:Uncharacterized protein n=1 Tax=Liparis tanakae TaxID=230148 RepID=A0A4Z2J5Y7_9TELE|nr:hypothetical protein EYF80_004239 [Liparis tanakae]